MIHIHLYILFSNEIMFRLMIDSSIFAFIFFMRLLYLYIKNIVCSPPSDHVFNVKSKFEIILQISSG